MQPTYMVNDKDILDQVSHKDILDQDLRVYLFSLILEYCSDEYAVVILNITVTKITGFHSEN